MLKRSVFRQFDFVEHRRAMAVKAIKRAPEKLQCRFRLLGGVSVQAQPFDQRLLAGHAPLALDDVAVSFS